MKKLRVLTVIQYDQDKFENEIADFFDENGIQPEDVVDIKYNVVNDNREIWFTAMIMYKIEVKAPYFKGTDEVCHKFRSGRRTYPL